MPPKICQGMQCDHIAVLLSYLIIVCAFVYLVYAVICEDLLPGCDSAKNKLLGVLVALLLSASFAYGVYCCACFRWIIKPLIIGLGATLAALKIFSTIGSR